LGRLQRRNKEHVPKIHAPLPTRPNCIEREAARIELTTLCKKSAALYQEFRQQNWLLFEGRGKEVSETARLTPLLGQQAAFDRAVTEKQCIAPPGEAFSLPERSSLQAWPIASRERLKAEHGRTEIADTGFPRDTRGIFQELNCSRPVAELTMRFGYVGKVVGFESAGSDGAHDFLCPFEVRLDLVRARRPEVYDHGSVMRD
jgi:hypothetical protein